MPADRSAAFLTDDDRSASSNSGSAVVSHGNRPTSTDRGVPFFPADGRSARTDSDCVLFAPHHSAARTRAPDCLAGELRDGGEDDGNDDKRSGRALQIPIG
jgi:hypothetical protein